MASKHSNGLGRPTWALIEFGVMMTNFPDDSALRFSILPSLILRIVSGDFNLNDDGDDDVVSALTGGDFCGEDVEDVDGALLLTWGEGINSSKEIICAFDAFGLSALHGAIAMGSCGKRG